MLLELQEQAFYLSEDLIEKRSYSELVLEMEQFIKKRLHARLPRDYKKYQIKYQLEAVKDRLNRPMRVCGMVKNEGEPGGGPFWVLNEYGQASLQIVESAQVDTADHRQRKIASNCTHFNPVDLVCGVRDYKGNKFDLSKFRDLRNWFHNL